VLLRTKHDVKVPLENPNNRSYKVLERVSDRIHIDGKPNCVSVDRLKPAYFIPENVVNQLLSNSGECSPVRAMMNYDKFCNALISFVTRTIFLMG